MGGGVEDKNDFASHKDIIIDLNQSSDMGTETEETQKVAIE